MILPLLIAVIFPGLMALSASMDFLTMTIPNPISVVLAIAYFALAAFCLPPQGILSDVSCGLTILIVAFAMFSAGWIGGGDAKLAAATALSDAFLCFENAMSMSRLVLLETRR